jgi:hypothetical protein
MLFSFVRLFVGAALQKLVVGQ